MEDKRKILSNIPAVDELLKNGEIEKLLFAHPRSIVVEAIREYLNEYRKFIVSSDDKNLKAIDTSNNAIIRGIIKKVSDITSFKLKNVVNATGVVLHTNLGRAILSPKLKDMLLNIATHYSNLEMNTATGERGSRYSHVEELICRLTGAEAAMAVNNNAAAVLLVLSTMAKDREVIVSRGQLVEIGGSFRVPDVMTQSGALLREVGTTNKTHLLDYENAVTENTAALLKVHTSNYRICGFTKEVGSEELVALGNKLGLPVIEDLGSGILIDLSKYGLPYEPTVQNSIKAGTDVVTFSGDKMLGGPQAGIIIGKKIFIDKMKKNPLTRAFRIDKLTLAALEGTLRLYLDEEEAVKSIPILKMLCCDQQDISKRAKRLYNKLKKSIGEYASIKIEDEFSEVGGGSMPLHKLPTKVISIQLDDISSDKLDTVLRQYKTPIIARINKDRLLLDIRTIIDDEFDIVENALKWSTESLKNRIAIKA